MGRKKKDVLVSLDTIWEIPDQAWAEIEPLLEDFYPAAPTGRKRADLRKVLNGLIFRLRTGCQWNHLPKIFGDDSTIHRWFQRWVGDGVLAEIWAVLLGECEELGGVDWRWQAADGCLGKARFGGAPQGKIRPTGAKPGRKKVSWSKPLVARWA